LWRIWHSASTLKCIFKNLLLKRIRSEVYWITNFASLFFIYPYLRPLHTCIWRSLHYRDVYQWERVLIIPLWAILICLVLTYHILFFFLFYDFLLFLFFMFICEIRFFNLIYLDGRHVIIVLMWSIFKHIFRHFRYHNMWVLIRCLNIVLHSLNLCLYFKISLIR
jgi:hypothetical protein